MKKLLSFILPLLFLSSCISEQEQEALSELAAYGGAITISSGMKSSTEDGSMKFKKLTINGSEAFESGKLVPEILASRFAITYFSKLKQEDRDFDKMQVEFVRSDGISYEAEFDREYLEKIESELQFVNGWITKIEKDKIEESYKDLSEQFPQAPDLATYVGKFEKLKTKFGTADSAWFDGFAHSKDVDSLFNKEVHQFIYDVKSKKGVYAVNVIIDPKEKGYKIHGLSFVE